MNVSIIVPVYGSAGCIEELVRRVSEAFAVSGYAYEILLVNDGSLDDSWARIRDAAAQNRAVRGINLRRNFGQDNALMAGIRESKGDIVVVMDDDLQHDPRDAVMLARQVEAGFDVCFARFPDKKQALWKNLGSWLNDKMANTLVDKPRDLYLSPFKAICGEVAREVADYDGPFPYLDGLLFRITRNVTQVDVEHHHRFAGQSHYTFRRSVSVWLRVATLFSLFPLRVATVLGFVFALIGLFLALFFTVGKIFYPNEPVGWASLIVAVLVLGGIQLAALGIIGEYIGRIYLHLNRRPQYSVKEKV